MGNAAQVAVGLGFVGLGTLACIAVAARTMAPAGFAVFVTWWTVTNLFALAFTLTEAYLPRVLIGAGEPSRESAIIARFARLEAGLLLAMGLVAVGSSFWAQDRLFGGNAALPWAALAYSVIAAVQSLQRGVAIGRGRFSVVSVQLVSDGTVRMLACAAIALGHWASPGVFAAALCVAALVGTVAAATRLQGWLAWAVRPDVRVDWVPLMWLSPSILAPLVVNNATVPWLAAGGEVSPHELGAFAGAVTLSRILTLLVGAAYGPVLNPLSNAVEAGDRPRFARIHRGAAAVAATAGGLYALGLWVCGPWLLHLYLGSGYDLSRAVFGVLALGSAFSFVAVVEQAALVALSHWHAVAVAWTIGLVAFAIALVAPSAPITSACIAMTLAPTTAWAIMWLARARWVRRDSLLVP
jgi:O-antigen/teichoic acid export membrane protein